MHELSAEILTTKWWVSVVVVGIAIHLVAGYLRPLIDRSARGTGNAVTRWWRNLNERERAEFIREVQLLVTSPERRLEYRFREVMAAVRMALYSVLLLGLFAVKPGATGAGFWAEFSLHIWAAVNLLVLLGLTIEIRRGTRIRAVLNAALRDLESKQDK